MLMKSKLLNLLLILTSFAGYLECGGDRHLFLYQAEIEIFTKLFTDPMSVIHPFTILPLFGQIALLITLFQKQPNKILTLAGIGGISVLLILMLVIGIMSRNIRIILSTLPFLITAIVVIRQFKRKRTNESSE